MKLLIVLFIWLLASVGLNSIAVVVAHYYPNWAYSAYGLSGYYSCVVYIKLCRLIAGYEAF